MKLSYAITVCNESKDLYSLISFLKKVKDPEDEINILVDSTHVSPQVLKVVEHFKSDIVLFEREFDGDFAEHRNYHISKCKGDYIFIIDADEMPQEKLIKNIKGIIKQSEADLIYVPRINIHPGSTQEFLDKCKFRVNEVGWINWPDMQSRIFKNKPDIRYKNKLHEALTCNGKRVGLPADPGVALWHIKSMEKQLNRWDQETFEYVSPKGDNLYDSLM
jgi:glycosyltransferase involved in cell wall biosynthesis